MLRPARASSMRRRRYSGAYGGCIRGIGNLLFYFSPIPSTKAGQLHWKPVQAFDDGSHEYLLFSNTAALESDMPSLYVEQGSKQELVNYQVRQNYYIVDRL